MWIDAKIEPPKIRNIPIVYLDDTWNIHVGYAVVARTDRPTAMDVNNFDYHEVLYYFLVPENDLPEQITECSKCQGKMSRTWEGRSYCMSCWMKAFTHKCGNECRQEACP